jgi:hypothetical protein
MDVLQAMPASVVAVALLGFMLGVEAGQQLVIVPGYLLLARLRRSARRRRADAPTDRRARRWASGAIAASGAWYLLQSLALSR